MIIGENEWTRTRDSDTMRVLLLKKDRRVGIYTLKKRILDFALAAVLIVILFIPMLLVALYVKCTSKGPALYWSNRVGINDTIFRMPKFRTMYVDTPQIHTNGLKNPIQHITSVGAFLRKKSIDELPQLFSIIKGDMSFVGPRPALYNQYDLRSMRIERGVHKLIPGLTGWAQINGRDDIETEEKVKHDEHYLRYRSFSFDLKIIRLTVWNVLCSNGVTH